ncbi:MAG: hypothetical protein LBS16_07900 [Prevotellaceae bacterium]|jgi:hypothetical protein|nr:hypothetical protein [Prevotellaceae bacterium]
MKSWYKKWWVWAIAFCVLLVYLEISRINDIIGTYEVNGTTLIMNSDGTGEFDGRKFSWEYLNGHYMCTISGSGLFFIDDGYLSFDDATLDAKDYNRAYKLTKIK